MVPFKNEVYSSYMKKISLLLLFFMFSAHGVQTKFISDVLDEKWQSKFSLGGEVNKGNVQSTAFNYDFLFGKRSQKISGYILGKGSFYQVGENPSSKIKNAGHASVRLHYHFSPKWSMVLFTRQGYNQIKTIDLHSSEAIGPAYTIEKEKMFYDLSLFLMHYREKYESISNRNEVRLSLRNYIKYKFEKFDLDWDVFYMPVISEFDNYRLLSFIGLKFSMIQDFMGFKYVLAYEHDNRPQGTNKRDDVKISGMFTFQL
jgi:hypothetical protein